MLHKTKLTVASALLAGIIGTGAIAMVRAQPMPPPGQDGGSPHYDDMHHHEHWMLNKLVVPAEDRQLTAPDVQKIAEAFLLWNGNRSWKVAGVTENADDTVGFAYVSRKGDIIAQFKVDRKTGHIHRVS